MKSLALALSSTLVLTLVGCSNANAPFDGSTEAAAQASMARMTKNMTPDEKEQFSKDCMTVVVGNEGLAGLMAMGTLGKGAALGKLDGMTVEQIRARAKEVRASSTLGSKAPAKPKKPSPLALDAWDFKFVPRAEVGVGAISDHYDFSVTLRNTGSVGIKLIDATAVFSDRLGTEMYTVYLAPDTKVPASSAKEVTGRYRISESFPGEARMKDMAKDDIVPSLKVRRLVFDDNSTFDDK